MIDAQEIQEMMKDCLFTPEELAKENPPKEFTPVEGVIQKFGLHPGRLTAKKERLLEILGELDSKFLIDTGGGWSFLNLPFDKDGKQWGEHREAEALIVMCIGNGLAEYCMPREMWEPLPGGVPFVVFSKTGFKK